MCRMLGQACIIPGNVNPSDMMMCKEEKTMEEGKDVHTNWVDESFLQTLDIKPLAGRLFSKDFPGDTSNRMILNAEAIKATWIFIAAGCGRKKITWIGGGKHITGQLSA